MREHLPLDKMTTAEKLRVIEQIWDDLCRNAEVVPSPTWHAPILSERESLMQQGQEHGMTWEDAKKSIRESLAESFGD